MADDPIVAAVIADLERRSAAGIEKYGTTLAGNPAPEGHWLQQAYEEALDLALYLRRAMTEAQRRQWPVRGAKNAYMAVDADGRMLMDKLFSSQRLADLNWSASAEGRYAVAVTIIPTHIYETIQSFLGTHPDNPENAKGTDHG